jgi:hypothetical protein
MTIYDKVLEAIPSKRHWKPIILKNIDPNLFDQLYSSTKYLHPDTKLSDRIIFCDSGLSELPRCSICNNTHQYINSTKQISKYCSLNCNMKDTLFTKSRSANVNQELKVQRMKATNLIKYGVEIQSQREEVKDKVLRRSKVELYKPDAFLLLNSKEWLYQKHVVEKLSASEIALDLAGIDYGTVIHFIKKHGIEFKIFNNRSIFEKEIESFVRSLGLRVETSAHILENKKMELDIYCPDQSVAIEANGVYTHSSYGEKKNRHLLKTEDCLSKNIKLIHINQEQWLSKRSICESMIRTRLKLTHKIFARQCQVRAISGTEYKIFCENNHISGHVGATVKLGLVYKNNLVQVMGFSKARFNKKYQWEIIRLCSSLNTTVVGGASKLFKYFCRTYNPESVISYSDRQYGEGDVYKHLGFIFSNKSEPGYMYSDGDKLYNRMNFQKHKLSKILKSFDPNKTEQQNMFDNGYKLYFDCGQNTWVWNNSICSK